MSVQASAWAFPKPLPHGKRPRQAAGQGPRLDVPMHDNQHSLHQGSNLFCTTTKSLLNGAQVDSAPLAQQPFLRKPLDNFYDHFLNSVRATQLQIQAPFANLCRPAKASYLRGQRPQLGSANALARRSVARRAWSCAPRGCTAPRAPLALAAAPSAQAATAAQAEAAAQ